MANFVPSRLRPRKTSFSVPQDSRDLFVKRPPHTQPHRLLPHGIPYIPTSRSCIAPAILPPQLGSLRYRLADVPVRWRACERVSAWGS
ncbi:hypothetical protein BDV95DRAFT_577463 [Massariosphaeria phaeospora]|uniref:Uncharacterized protein n=1 Tax=Massariosphaeria phaeospora TaxID=100035 RepID=A0A7C8IC56_9PLEO|nr:hypothetical protein BDV95DRAFT_577463 [Massariosphaeria phaeospora]